jgi:hypothetical protein
MHITTYREIAMKTPAEVAEALKDIYETDFGGKARGRYQISRPALRELSGRGRLEESTVEAIVSEAYELGFVVTDLGDDFSVVEVDVMRSYRKVPSRVIQSLAA